MEYKFSYSHLICAFTAVLIILMYNYPIIFYIFLFILYSLILIIVVLFVQYNRNKSTTIKPVPASAILYNATRSRMFDIPKRTKANMPVIFGRTIDNLLQQILGNALDDFVNSWLGKVVYDEKEFIEIIREDLWIATQKLIDRLRKIDAPKIFFVDFVTKVTSHLERIRQMKENNEVTLKMSNYLVTDDKEIEFLKKISEIVIILLLPRGYSIAPLKNLLCEVFAFKIFYLSIKIVINPDYINQKIVELIQLKLASVAMSRRSYEYATSFQDFLKIINNCTSIDELLQMRSSIINDLMQATTTQNLQRAKGIDLEVGSSNLKRSDINCALKLKKYIQQLSYAKNQCEKALNKCGWVGNCSNDELNLTLQDILSTVIGRKYFTIFLESLNAGNLIGFYSSVEELKTASRSNIHQIGAEIFYAYIRPNFEIKLDKSDQKKLEGFLMGEDSNYEVFFDIQKNVFRLLNDKYYQPFVMSEEYKKMKNSIATEDVTSISNNSIIKTNFDGNGVDESQEDYDTEMDLANHSTYAKNKLEQLQERLKTKKSALEALKSSLKPDSQVLSILEKDIENLKNEKRQLESHLLRTETWTANLGKFHASVENCEINDEKHTIEFLIVVSTDEIIEAKEDETFEVDENISTGWVVLRTLDDFHELHKKIRPLCTELKSLDLPSNNTFILFFGKNDKGSLDKAKMQIQRYLNFIMENTKLIESEFLFTFLSPSCDKLKTITPSPKKPRFFSIATLFKSTSSSTSSTDQLWGTRDNNDDDDDLLLVSDSNDSHMDIANKESKTSSQIDDIKDSIAEPIYHLLSEIFELNGPFKFLRKSLISFVQLTYGGTINRQLRDLVFGYFDEASLHQYASRCLKTFWPTDDEVTKTVPERTDDMKEMTAHAARSLIIDNIPDILCSLVGQQNAKNGLIKIFEVLQNEKYNKQLIYDLLEVLLVEVFPEIKSIPTSK
ncbi:hypothetical protein PVAND_013879 [Polypedilum vanderplanki]|uniref:Sorting nexin-25-like protein n=1 Tax=Polypedilum vanderplanki TaxID=319348 RepID=A0A9J6CRK5_POLVA|nr:hypothetical protein PVAND_013879 [Polypedilum vanderplanki]